MIWLADVIPTRWQASNGALLKCTLYAASIGYLIALLASLVGMIVAAVFLARKQCRSKGVVYPTVTVLASLLFLVFFLVLPISRSLRMRSQEFDFVPIGTKVILFDPTSQSKGIAILDTQAQQMESSGVTGTCTIKNLTTDLKLASHMTIECKTGSQEVVMTAYSVQTDAIPYYPDVHGYEDNGLSHPSTSTYTAPTSNVVRINGELMSLGEAVDRFPRIPPLEEMEP